MKVVIAQDRGETLPDEPLPEPPPIQTPDLDYVIATWLQHKIHHTYPKAGGYDDQDELLMEDWHTLNLFYARVESGQLSALYIPQVHDDARSWSDMAGE